MIKKILNTRLPLVIYAPQLVFDINFFRESFLAGGLPVLDTEFYDNETVIEILDSLDGEKILFGLRVPVTNKTIIDKLTNAYKKNLDLVVFSYATVHDLEGFSFDTSDYRFVIEVTDIEINETLEKIDPSALVLKGNEASGKVSKYSSFIMMQWYLGNANFPVFIQGGVGRFTSAGIFAAGASGVVMDSQLYLCDESPLSKNFRELISGIEENDSQVVGSTLGVQYRFFAKLGTKIVKTLKALESTLAGDADADQKLYTEIVANITAVNDHERAAMQSLFYLGQDGAFANSFKNTGKNGSNKLQDIVREYFKKIDSQLAHVEDNDPIRPHTDLAKEHNTRLPVIQGPMANISDNADFALKILENDALPFYAVGSLPAELAEKMIGEGSRKVKNFGAGLVGIEAFNPGIAAHLESVKKHHVPFALFAGGIPSQVNELEESGTRTYLHTPSVMMLENAVNSGCKRFILEGTEAGGHVGTLTSLVLWELCLEKLARQEDATLKNQRIIFAGGISTTTASHFITGLASTFSKRGAGIGIQIGSAYLFTEEIVETGCIKKLYRDIVQKANETIVIGNTVGLASRTVATPFTEQMIHNEHDRVKEGIPLSERKTSFERENIGSLLIGAKGVTLNLNDPKNVTLQPCTEDEQLNKGNFLVGDSLAFFSSNITIKNIHDRYFEGKKELNINLDNLEVFSSEKSSINDDIAIIGMGCLFPDAPNPETLWANILSKKYSIREMPDDRFNKDLYYDADKKAEDKTYTKIAGVMDEFVFDHERFGYTPEKASKISRSQQIVLEAAYQAVEDANLLDDDGQINADKRKRTAVIVASCLGNELGNSLHLKFYYPEIRARLEQIEEFRNLNEEDKEKILDNIKLGLNKNCEGHNNVHGVVINIEASRIAKHLGITGANYTVDAACATSFAAIDCGIKELLSGSHDTVIVGGLNTNFSPEPFVGFCKMGALSATGSYPFDERANGFVIGEGTAVFVMKRMRDALRDGDKITGIIRGIGSSSDGKGKAIAAPNPTGQKYALDRCFESIKGESVDVSHIDFIEAHGTSTIQGDLAELEVLKDVYNTPHPIGISSVKSQIGHLLGGAGAAGLTKVLLALNNKIIPPNGHFEKLSKNHNLDDTSLYIIEEAQEWETTDGRSRKAAISSYGFGGINYHLIIEENSPSYRPLKREIFSNPDYDFNNDRIVIAGAGVVLPGANDCDSFWDRMVEGKKTHSPIPDSRFHNSYYAMEDKTSDYRIPEVQAGLIKDFKFNNVKYRIPPKATRSIDRAQLFALDATNQALTNSNLMPLLTPGNKTAVILGTIPGEIQVENVLRVRTPFVEQLVAQTSGLEASTGKIIGEKLSGLLKERYVKNTEDTIPGLLSNVISGRIANFFGCNGANFTVDASCASATVAIETAIKGLKSKDFDFVVTGGVDANLYPSVLMAFQKLGILSDSECRFFDSRSNGYVMSEGAAVQVLTTYGQAVKNNMPIMAEIYGTGFNSSVPGHLLAPSQGSYSEAIENCYGNINVKRKQIAHLDVFGVSNPMLDAMEKQAIEKSFSDPMFFGNIKPEFGYFKSANPAVALTKLALMCSKKQLLPNHSFSKETSIVAKSPILNANPTLKDMSDKHTLFFASNVNGIGGNHCHMVTGTLPEFLHTWESSETIEVKALPAKQPAVTVKGQTVTAKAPAVSKRKDMQPKAHYPAPTNFDKKRCVVLLTGQGAQHPGMMKELYDNNKTIRNILDRGDEIFNAMRGYSLLGLMFGESDLLNETENTQPATFISSAAIYHYLSEKGFTPDNFIGHSVGEYTALYCNNMINFDTAMKLIIKRSDFMKRAAESKPGRIMVVFKNPKETQAIVRESSIANIYVANKNSEKQTAVSGGQSEIDLFCKYLKSKDIMHKKLTLSGAFHTPLFNQAARDIEKYVNSIYFKATDYSRIISNVTGAPYPNDPVAIKALLVRQITSPVEFIKSVEGIYTAGKTQFIEIGPGKILTGLLKYINIMNYESVPAVDPKVGELVSLKQLEHYLEERNLIFTKSLPVLPLAPSAEIEVSHDDDIVKSIREQFQPVASDDFDDFKNQNTKALEKLLYSEFLKHKRSKAADAFEKFNFKTDRVMISGVSIGLPGKAGKVFESNNFDKLLAGRNFIDPLSMEDKEKITDKNITRVFKQPDGNAKFVEISSTEDVIQLAGQLGYFDLNDEYGIKRKYDIAMSLAIAAGIEALKDANIPLVMQYKKTSTGSMIPEGFALPKEMQDDTGIIVTSLFPNSETLIDEMTKYYYNKFYVQPYNEFENIYYHLMESVKDPVVKEQVTDWFFKVKERRKEYSEYKFDRNFIVNMCPLGSAHLAQIIKAKGPNLLLSGACASTTQAVSVSEDWIRTGRCSRVIVIGGENATSSHQNQWIGTSFLSLGAATIKKSVSDAAKPFDANRNGTILGSGAVSIIVEREDKVRHRGMKGQAEILGTHIGNSAFHAFNIDVKHLSSQMNDFVSRVEKRHKLKKQEYAPGLLFMAHETYTPARGGSADAEVTALKVAYPDQYQDITITNTKGYTGHTLGAAIEDAVLVKAMQKGIAPPIPNLTHIPEHFMDLNLNKRRSGDYRYGIHLAAGFGSHLAFLMVKRVMENPVEGNQRYKSWLASISGQQNPETIIINKTLCVDPKAATPLAPPVETAEKETAKKSETGPMQKASTVDVSAIIKGIIAEQTGYSDDMLEDELDLEADLGIDTVKQVEIFGKVSSSFGLDVPEDLKLKELNTISKLTEYISANTGGDAGTVADVQSEGAGKGSLDVIKGVIAEQTGYTNDMLEADLDLEADLGIDTVKQVEIFGKVSSSFGLDVPEDLKLKDLNTISKLAEYIDSKTCGSATASQPSAVRQTEETTAAGSGQGSLEVIREIICEQTGYSVDMLEEELDLEADLGIDTVKQVEIFGKVSSSFGLDVPEDLQLKELNTIKKLADYIDGKIGPTGPGSPDGGPGKKEAPETAPTEDKPDHMGVVRDIISEQTGYTVDMLEEDLDLEADLGIDTVKQVEIFGKVSSSFGLEVPEDLQLKELNTIRKLADYIGEKSGSKRATPTGKETEQIKEVTPAESATPAIEKPHSQEADADLPDGNCPVKRLVVRVRETDLPEPVGTSNLFKDKTILITGDQRGFTKAIAEKIAQKGGKTVVIGNHDAVDFKLDLTDLSATEKAVSTLAETYPKASGLIHLAPLDYYFNETREISDEELNASVKSLFILVKGLYPLLDKEDTLIGTMGFGSVIFPYMKGKNSRIHPSFAGISGMMKTMNKELSNTLVKIVDFAQEKPLENIEKLSEQFMGEILSKDTHVETGYDENKKFILSMKQKLSGNNTPVIQKGGRILVTGGAGGITYEILKKVSGRYMPKLVILAINDIHSVRDEFLTPTADQKFILQTLKTEMKGKKPLEIKRAVDRILRLKQSISNIEHLKSMGVEVEHICTDVTNFEAVKKAVDRYESFDGVIHAAGMEQSQFIPKKELSSFNIVMDVKVKGMLNLLKALGEKDYNFFMTFSSVTARFGNEGQVDYTGANDMIGKILLKEQIKHPDRRYKICAWTAWSGTGMATNETVMKVLKDRGIVFLPMEQGVSFFMAELLDSFENEAVFSGLDFDFDRDNILEGENSRSFPFLDAQTKGGKNTVAFSRDLNLERDPFLMDHSMDDVPIFLGSTGIEAMAEAAVNLAGADKHLVELSDFSIPYGIKILKGRPKALVIKGQLENNHADCSIISQFTNPKGVVMGDPTLHYKGRYRFGTLEDVKISLPEFSPVSYDGKPEDLIYHPKRLFMDGLFHTIMDVASFDDKLLITRIKDQSEKEFFTGVTNPEFATDAVIIDAMFQTGGLFEFFTTNITVLPYRIKSLKFYKRVSKNADYLCMTSRTAQGDETNTYQIDLVDGDGNLFIRVEDFEMVRLNKLEEQYRIDKVISYKAS